MHTLNTVMTWEEESERVSRTIEIFSHKYRSDSDSDTLPRGSLTLKRLRRRRRGKRQPLVAIPNDYPFHFYFTNDLIRSITYLLLNIIIMESHS